MNLLKDKTIHEKLKNDIGEERYIHSLGVEKTARELSRKYGCNEEKAAIAGFLHDCGKLKDPRDILKMSNNLGIMQDSVLYNNPALLHGPLGAELAKDVYNVKDEEILHSICYHTTGKPNMTLLDKIVYLSDYIEPNRCFEGVDDLRKIAYIDINKALLLSMENSIKHIVDSGRLLHYNTINARNDLLIKLKENRR